MEQAVLDYDGMQIKWVSEVLPQVKTKGKLEGSSKISPTSCPLSFSFEEKSCFHVFMIIVNDCCRDGAEPKPCIWTAPRLQERPGFETISYASGLCGEHGKLNTAATTEDITLKVLNGWEALLP